MLKFAVYTAVLLAGAQASAVCQWTVERKEDFFAQDLRHMQKPKIEKAPCKAGLPPVCVGFIYCPTGKEKPEDEPAIEAVACKSVPGLMGAWRCPAAQICLDDGDIELYKNKNVPMEGGAAPAPSSSTITK